MPQEKYIQFMEAVAKMRRLQKKAGQSKWGCSYDNKLAHNAERHVDDLIIKEVGRTAKVQNELFKD